MDDELWDEMMKDYLRDVRKSEGKEYSPIVVKDRVIKPGEYLFLRKAPK